MHNRYQKELVTIIQKYLPNATIYLFGSRARSTHNPGSDIDVALDQGTKIDWSILGSIQEDLAASDIPLFVDLVDLQDISKEMKKNILNEGIIWNKKH